MGGECTLYMGDLWAGVVKILYNSIELGFLYWKCGGRRGFLISEGVDEVLGRWVCIYVKNIGSQSEGGEIGVGDMLERELRLLVL